MIKKFVKYILFYKTRIMFNIEFLNKNKGRKKIVCWYLRNNLEKKYNVIVGNESEIGVNLKMPHPHNIVIGKKVKIGDNCTIYHGVTLGQNRDLYPKVGNNVIIYSGAKIIGNIKIGNNCVIGANTVVTKDVPDNAIVGGIPAKLISIREEKDGFY